MTRLILVLVSIPGVFAANVDLHKRVRSTERAFAKTMADRDPAAFATLLSKDTVFMSGEGVGGIFQRSGAIFVVAGKR